MEQNAAAESIEAPTVRVLDGSRSRRTVRAGSLKTLKFARTSSTCGQQTWRRDEIDAGLARGDQDATSGHYTVESLAASTRRPRSDTRSIGDANSATAISRGGLRQATFVSGAT